MKQYITSKKEELVAKMIVDAAYNVHKNLGPGLLEKIYSPCWIVVSTKFVILIYL